MARAAVLFSRVIFQTDTALAWAALITGRLGATPSAHCPHSDSLARSARFLPPQTPSETSRRAPLSLSLSLSLCDCVRSFVRSLESRSSFFAPLTNESGEDELGVGPGADIKGTQRDKLFKSKGILTPRDPIPTLVEADSTSLRRRKVHCLLLDRLDNVNFAAGSTLVVPTKDFIENGFAIARLFVRKGVVKIRLC